MLAHGQTVRVTAPCVARAREGAKGTPHATIARITPRRKALSYKSRSKAVTRSVAEPEHTPPSMASAPGPATPPGMDMPGASDAARQAHDHAAALAVEAAAAQAQVAAAQAQVAAAEAAVQAQMAGAAAGAAPTAATVASVPEVAPRLPPTPTPVHLNITTGAVPGLFDLPTVGAALPLGASLTADGVNFAVYAAPEAHAVVLCLFTPEDLRNGKPPTHEIPLDPEANRTGNVWHAHLPKCSDQLLYGYRVDGPKNQHKGQMFDKDLVLLDPYATTTVSGDRTKYGVPSLTAKIGEECWPQYAGAVPSRTDVFDWEGVTSPGYKMGDLCVYETHVRGLTAAEPNGGTYKALIDKLPYLKRMGFNALELMPIAEFNELEYYSDNPVTGEKRFNFWGYSTVNFFSPKQLFAQSAGEDCGRAANRELKTMVRECHRNGIEVILDVVFNHTAEGNERGLSLSLRGFDNRTYYMVAPEGQFYNYSGCGNTVNCNHPVVRQMIVDCLKHWVTEYHIDGFRFDLASIMTRAQSNWDQLSGEGWPTTGENNNEISVGDALGDPPVVAMISNDPVLGDVKLIAEAWDAGGLYQVGSFPHYGKWAEWNGRFRDDARNFIRGFDGYAGLFAECICGSPSLYKDSGRKPYHSINFITAHDGFTLRDLVSYNEKHNDANGENNADGEENNQSWNCGLGPHEDGVNATPVAKVLRDRQMRNFFAALFVSQGTPMVYQGDEYGATKGGNNNTYCHDNFLNWVDWDSAKDPVKNTGLSRFCRLMRQFKAKQPALRLNDFPNENNIKWHGVEPNQPSWEEENRFVAFTVQSHDPGSEIGLGNSEQIYVAFNAYHLPAKVVLPNPPDGCAWKMVADSALQPPYDFLDADDIPAQSKAAAEAMLKPQLASNCYTVMDRASVVMRAERVKPWLVPEPVAVPVPAPVEPTPAPAPAA